MHAPMSILRSRCYVAALLIFFFTSFITATAPRAQNPCTDDMIWAVFPTSKELGDVNDQLLTKSSPTVNQDGPLTFSMIWQGAASSRSVSVTVTEYPDPAPASKKVHEYGFDDKKGQIKTGMIKLGFVEEGYKTDDIQRPYYLVHKGQFVLSYYTSYPGRGGGLPGDQDPTVAKIIQNIAALPCLGATGTPPPSKTSSNVASSPQDPKAINPNTGKGPKADAAGTTGTDKKPASNAAAASGVTNAPQPTGGACDWSGTWNTNRGKMELVQKGNARAGADVSGTASLMVATAQNQTGTIAFQDVSIVAIVLDGKLAGTWSQPPSYGPPKDAGDIEFMISQDCSSFTGNWRYGYRQAGPQTPWDGDWTGTRSGAGTPPSTPVTKQTACASAKPSITDGSVFKRAEFTIGGTEPQKVTITSSADNFAIKEEYGGIVYQRIDGKSWGSLTLEPGNYILSCSGGGAMGLMSASVCVEYPLVGGAVPPGTHIVPPPGSQTVPPEAEKKKKLPGEEAKPALPHGPIERIFVRSADPNDSPTEDHLYIVIGKEKRFWAWGEDAAGHKQSVIVTEWSVLNDKNVGTIENDGGYGVFKAGPNLGDAKIMARVKVGQIDITGVFDVTVVAVPPNRFIGHLKLYDLNGKERYAGGAVVELTSFGYRNRKDYEDNKSTVKQLPTRFTRTNIKGKFAFDVPVEIDHLFVGVSNFWIPPFKVPVPPGFTWRRGVKDWNYSNDAHGPWPVETDKPVLVAPKHFECFKLWLEKLPDSLYIKGRVTHRGKPVDAEVKLFYHTAEMGIGYCFPDGTFTLYVDHLKKQGSYRLIAEHKIEEPNITTVHNLLKQKEDIWVDLPLKTTSVTINIEMITFAEKIGYTGP